MTKETLDFYFTPSCCSQATHILLKEAGLAFRGHRVDIFQGKLTDGGDFKTINPNGYVPALMLPDGMLLTENVAILDWIAMQGTALMPAGPMGRTRHLQMLAFLSTEVQKPFVRLFFSQNDEEKAYLRQSLARRFDWLCSQHAGDFIFGDRFTAADAFLYVMLRWAGMAQLNVPAVLQAFARRMEHRPAVQETLLAESAEPLHAAA